MNKIGAKEIAVIVDALVSIVLFFVGKYVPAAAEDVKFLIVALQPIVAIFIGLVSVENTAKIRAGK